MSKGALYKGYFMRQVPEICELLEPVSDFFSVVNVLKNEPQDLLKKLKIFYGFSFWQESGVAKLCISYILD